LSRSATANRKLKYIIWERAKVFILVKFLLGEVDKKHAVATSSCEPFKNLLKDSGKLRNMY
jgi:hypothetical protein